MNSINLSVEHAHKTHNFTLLRTSPRPHYPTFAQICEALIHHLKLRAKPSQLIAPHPPIHVWYFDGDDLIRVRSDGTIREALRKSPHKLRLRVKYRRGRSSKSETSAPSHPPTRSDTLDEPDQPSPTTLLRLLNHAENHALDATVEALDELRQNMLKFSGDAANLANARHRLSRLFCSFLRRLATTPVDEVPDSLQERLISRLEVIFEDEDISEGTVRAARRAVRVMCGDRHALVHMRSRWNTISARLVRATPPSTAAPSSKATSKDKTVNRPIKHYQNHVQKLVDVGGSDVKDASKRLMKYVEHHDAFNTADPGISRKLCRSVEKVVFHVVRCHKKEGKFVIQSHAARALASSVGRKFERAGFSKRFVSRASSLTRAMVDDPDVVELAYIWAKKRSDREASADDGDSGKIRRLAEEDEDELLGGRRDVDDDTTSSSSSASSSTSTSSADDDIIGGSRRSRSASSRRSRSASRGSHASRRSRSGSRSVSRKSGSRSASRAGSRGRSRSAGKGAHDAGSVRSRSRSRSKSRSQSGRGRSRSRSQTGSQRSGRSDSRESRSSIGRLEEDADDEILRKEELGRRLDEIAADEEESESHSDDEMKIYRYGGKLGVAEGSVLSDDTAQSQWARVQMEKEKEKLRTLHVQDRDLFGDRDGRTQVDVSSRLRSAKDSVALRDARDVPNPSDDEQSMVSDEPVRRVESMRSSRSPQRHRKSRPPFRSDRLLFREVTPEAGLVR